jgi:flagellar basal body rod protein FlgG
MNTTGFKAQSTNFSDLFYQQIGSTGSGDGKLLQRQAAECGATGAG